MAGEDEGTDRRSEADPDVPQPSLPPSGRPRDGEPPEAATDNARTQLLPMVGTGPGGPVNDAPSVRAVARRPATALPALGRKGGEPALPMSARATVDRRRRAVAADALTTEPTVDPPAITEPSPEQSDDAPDPESVPGRHVASPRVGATLDVAFRESQTGEWIVPVEREPAAEVRSVTSPVARVAAAVRVFDEPSGEVVRRGPSVLEADSWDAAPPVSENGDYQGRRRTVAPASRWWLIVVLVLVAAGAAVAITWTLTLGGSGVAVGPSPTMADNGDSGGATSGSSSTPVAPSVSALPAVGASPPHSSQGPSPSVEPSATPPPTVALLSRGRPTATSALEGNGSLTGANAVDGNPATRWSSAWSDPQWISVDLGSVYSITLVRLSWEAAYARSYEIQTSVDNTSWTALYATTSGDGGVDEATVTGTGRWVRVFGTQRATKYGYSLWELEIFGTTT